MRQLEPSHYGLQLRKLVDENIEYCIPAPSEYMQEQVSVYWLWKGTLQPLLWALNFIYLFLFFNSMNFITFTVVQ